MTISELHSGGVERMRQVYDKHAELGPGLREELRGDLREMYYSAQRALHELTDIINQHATYVNVDKLHRYLRVARQYCSYR